MRHRLPLVKTFTIRQTRVQEILPYYEDLVSDFFPDKIAW